MRFVAMVRRLDEILYRKNKSLGTRTALFPLYLLSLPYGLAVRMRVFAFSAGLLKRKRLPCPVVSVGNITVGGTGKTPLVMAAAKTLREKGIPVAILSRGYRSRKGSGFLVSDGEKILLSPEEAGDEPYLMAETLPNVPVLIGKDRYAVGRWAFENLGVRGFLLDDGYQHLPLHRDLDVVLIDSQVLFGDGHLLPRGVLREPLSSLRRAQIIVLTKAEASADLRPAEAEIRRIHPGAEIYHSSFQPIALSGPHGEREELDLARGRKVIALSGVGNPAYFRLLLEKCGMKVAGEVVFPDHHAYEAGDLTSLKEKVNKFDYIVTTEKDMVKLKKLVARGLPVRALRIEMRIHEERFFERVSRLFSAKEERRP